MNGLRIINAYIRSSRITNPTERSTERQFESVSVTHEFKTLKQKRQSCL